MEIYLLNPLSKAHSGFYNAYKDIGDYIKDAVSSLKFEHPDAQLIITGHSLGGALALLSALDLKYHLQLDPSELVLYTFG